MTWFYKNLSHFKPLIWYTVMNRYEKEFFFTTFSFLKLDVKFYGAQLGLTDILFPIIINAGN